jgi:hypothetical protein
MSLSAVEWNVEKVVSFLKEKEVDEDLVALFQAGKIDGAKFLTLNDDSLKALGIKRAMDRGFIKTLIAELLVNLPPVHVVPAPSPGSGPPDFGFCAVHKLPRGATYCDACKTLLCHECIVTTHKGHKFSSVSDVASKIRESLKEKAAVLGEVSKDVCEQIISECFQSLEKLKESHVSCVEQVEAVFDAFQSALDEAKERILKSMKESGTEKEGLVQVELETAREWKKEGELLVREAKELMAQDDVSLMRSEHVLSPLIEGLLSTQPTMEPVKEIEAIVSKQSQDQLVKMFESVVTIRGQFSLFLLLSFLN